MGKGPLDIKFEIPEWKLEFSNVQEVVDEVGQAVAKMVVDRTRSGLDAEGKQLHRPLDGGQPMNRSGQLLNSIRWKQSKNGRSGTVRPTGSRTRKKGTKKQPNNVGVLRSLAVEDRRDNGTRPPMVIMDATPDERKRIVEQADKTLKVDLVAVGRKGR